MTVCNHILIEYQILAIVMEYQILAILMEYQILAITMGIMTNILLVTRVLMDTGDQMVEIS